MVVFATLYALAMAVLLFYGANLLWMALVFARKDRLRQGTVPDPNATPVPPPSWPLVTVQLPVYNEALVVERLIDACATLDYPLDRLEIQVLDDSTDDTTALVARRVAYWQARNREILHIHRSSREGFKAGALQNGLRIAQGELLAIFDADFIPQPAFLRQVVPHCSDPAIGMVQTRWGHLNADDTILTRLQAFGLDAHFALEQYVRNQTGCFINFNGTAGIWRRACIEEAGGWQGDTLAEDLDLSYRAQLRGWQFAYLPVVEVPAELPVDINALRAQQFRWTKGAAETTLKLIRTFWQADLPFRVKLEGTIHLTAHLAFPAVLLAMLLHAPLLWMKNLEQGPGNVYFGVMGLGLLGFAGFFLAHLFAQRDLYPSWEKRLAFFPVFMAGSMGMALNNTRALFLALRGKKTAFMRTPKYNTAQADKKAWWRSRYADNRIPPLVWLEVLLALYCTFGVVVIVMLGEWAALPFQACFATGFGLVTLYNVRQYFLTHVE